MHRSEVFANLTRPMRSLVGMATRGELVELLAADVRPVRPVSGGNRRLSTAEIDQLVTGYHSLRSIYRVADLYGLHRNTVAQHLKDRGVRLGLLPLQTSEIERVRELHDHGLSLNAIGRTIGRDPKTVKAALG